MKKKSFADILCDISDSGLTRVQRKVPEWAGVDGLVLPTQICTEQCSSSATALYKARLISRLPSCRRIVDLTGGLGVDAWAFSQVAESVHHNEMDAALSAAVRHNFSALGISNATFSSIEVTPLTLQDVLQAAGGGCDVLFLDPARRDGAGRKVFLMEDCSPDVLALKGGLLSAAPHILLKLSPMADISMACSRLGAEVKEVHVLGAEGECKELLVLLERGWDGGYAVTVCPDSSQPDECLTYCPAEEAGAIPVFHDGPEALGAAGMLFEPCAALLKAGCFRLLCERYGLVKLGRFTHLYTCSEEAAAAIRPLGKLFSINETVPFGGANIKALGRAYARCEVTARNLPITSDELRKRMGAASGGDTHVFAFTADFNSAPSARLMAVCVRVS